MKSKQNLIHRIKKPVSRNQNVSVKDIALDITDETTVSSANFCPPLPKRIDMENNGNHNPLIPDDKNSILGKIKELKSTVRDLESSLKDMDREPMSEKEKTARDAKNIGIVFRRIRKSYAFSQEGVALAAGITQGHLSRIESGDLFPKMETLKKLSAVYKVPLLLIISLATDVGVTNLPDEIKLDIKNIQDSTSKLITSIINNNKT